MPVSTMDFWLTAIAYILAVIIPIFGIRYFSNGLGSIRNRFDIISALISYPLIIFLGNYLVGQFHSLFGENIANIYIGFAISISIAFSFIWLAQTRVQQ